jgi:hypothetical protein
MEFMEKEIEELIKQAKKEGSITREDIGTKLIKYDLTNKDLEDVVERLQNEGCIVEDE